MYQLYLKGEKFYKGYCDDARNTDNAWLEVVVCNYHDSDYAFSLLIDEVRPSLIAYDSCTICLEYRISVVLLSVRKIY